MARRTEPEPEDVRLWLLGDLQQARKYYRDVRDLCNNRKPLRLCETGQSQGGLPTLFFNPQAARTLVSLWQCDSICRHPLLRLVKHSNLMSSYSIHNNPTAVSSTDPEKHEFRRKSPNGCHSRCPGQFGHPALEDWGALPCSTKSCSRLDPPRPGRGGGGEHRDPGRDALHSSVRKALWAHPVRSAQTLSISKLHYAHNSTDTT